MSLFDEAVAQRFEEELAALHHGSPIFPAIRLVAHMRTNADARVALFRLEERMRELEEEHNEIERRAQEIYNGWSNEPAFRPWRPGGNSEKQAEARSMAQAEARSKQVQLGDDADEA